MRCQDLQYGHEYLHLPTGLTLRYDGRDDWQQHTFDSGEFVLSDAKVETGIAPVMSPLQLSEHLHTLLQECGGFTLRMVPCGSSAFWAPIPATSGFVVGGLSPGVAGRDLRPLDVQGFLIEHLGQIPVTVGGWLDQETGITHLDMVAIYTSRDEAEHVARRNNQIAIWDLERSQEIRL